MKHHSILSLFIFLLGFGAVATSCEDMLTPDLDRYSTDFSGKDTVYFYHGILRNVQDMVEQNQLLGDIRSDLADTTLYTSDSVAAIATYDRANMVNGENGLLNRAAYYKVINQCNFYLAKVDTMAKKNNVYYMRKEAAQVENIRAWAYLQLVQTYGRVPFITKPVDNANTGWEKNPEAWADADNLVDLLLPGLKQSQQYERKLGYPSYGSYNTGSVSINSITLRFYSDIILGDLYLLRGRDKNDYVEAAKNYYHIMNERLQMGTGYGTGTNMASFMKVSSGGRTSYVPSALSWMVNFFSSTPNYVQNITVIPSAANSSFGRVMSNVNQIYGFDVHSTNTTTSTTTKNETSGKDETTTTTTGSITLTANIRSRQIGPSQAYLNLNKAQNYTQYELDNNNIQTKIEYFDGAGDARVYATAPIFRTSTGDQARFILKDNPSSSSLLSSSGQVSYASFKYYRSVYRMRQIYLRYAEAINRAGYPRLAFAVLRNGLNINNLPSLADSIRYDDVNKTKQTVYYLDSINTYNNTNYIGLDELRRMEDDPQKGLYLDYNHNWWTSNAGIHEFGCGETSNMDSLYSYDKVIPQRIEDEARRNGSLTAEVEAKVKALRAHRVLPSVKADGDEEGGEVTEPVDRSDYTEIPAPSYQKEADPLEIDAVESLIADESALETAFEGTRMFDLIRWARHKNYDTNFDANYGTKWLAWKIARRSVNLKPFENVNEKDNRLYNLLLTPDNWYIPNPEY